MELHTAIHAIVHQFGRTVIRTEVLCNYLADFNAFEEKPTKMVMRTLLKAGYGERFFLLDEANSPDRLLKAKSFENEIIQNFGFQPGHVRYVIDCITHALEWNNSIPVLELQSANAGETEDTTNKHRVNLRGIPLNLIFVEGGTFDMGATPEQGIFAAFDEKPSVKTTVKDFYIAETAVTQKLWKAVMDDNPSHFHGEDLPVERVTWEECQTFIERLNLSTGMHFRMPTEAEWEYAARGGKHTMHFKFSGCNDNAKNDFVVCKDNAGKTTHPVKDILPNELGIHGMSGNVSEWCQDWYFNSYANGDSRENPSGPSSGIAKVHRGGSWDDKAMNCRVAKRFNMNPTYRNKLVGLRLAASKL